jgi:hypothetical protein
MEVASGGLWVEMGVVGRCVSEKCA